MFSFIVGHFPAVAVAVPVVLFIIAGMHSARKRNAEAARIRAEEAARETREAASREKRRQAAARKASQEAAAKVAAARRAVEQQQKREAREAAREARETVQKQRRAEKLEAARLLAEYNERSLQAVRELRELETARAAAPAQAPEAAPAIPNTAPAPAPAPEKAPANISYNNPFFGQVVSFTGKLQSMKRADAIAAVQAAGGRAYADFPAGTTILVVGTNPGQKKQDKYDKWIGQVKKITEAQFMEMLKKGACAA